MKKVIFTLAIAVLGLTAGAQDKKGDKSIKFGVGATLGLPIGDAKTFSNLVYGGDIQAEYAAAETVGLTLSAGYNSFAIKGGFGLSVTAIPVLVGGKFYFSEKAYGHAQAGVAFLNNGGGTGFVYAPAIGYSVSENFDLAVKYQAISKNGTTSYIGLRIGYSF
jgi:hypothetical protein